ncbi:uncharacterized protein A4U43_C05F4690 [Asparagus officinalis]|uniref:Uncharacterized protein n=1 Tax=Asparagus officinalis TaxID=4686 RepID=A0A5P1EQE1_ASPOF|nr:uncharacterized protein A4U43_C05F4690 [Asparagus officinalis]
MTEMSHEEHDKMAAKTQFFTLTIGRITTQELLSLTLKVSSLIICIDVQNNNTMKDSFDLCLAREVGACLEDCEREVAGVELMESVIFEFLHSS